MRVVVDNSTGGDVQLAVGVVSRLRDLGFDVEVHEPAMESMFDTSVNLVTTGIVLRVDERPRGADLAVIKEAVRAALLSASPRRRTRAVPVALGHGGRVLTWIDVFE